MKEKLKELNDITAELYDIGFAQSLLGWDRETYMPVGGAEARGQVVATLGKISHKKATSPKVGKLLDELVKYAEDLDPDSDEARIIKNSKRGYDQNTKVPPEMVEERILITNAASMGWREAREKSDYSIFQPHMEKIVDFAQRFVDIFQPYDHPYDVLFDLYEPDMKTADAIKVFDDIRPKQVALIKAISEKQQVEDKFLHQKFPIETQKKIGTELIAALGYDPKNGRQDVAAHPFSTTIGYGDNRITVRFDENFFNPYMFAAMHETGHAMYSLGIPKDNYRTAIYGSCSSALQESQSRLWENLVGRSKPFWEGYYPKLQEYYPTQFGNVSLEEFYKAINIVKPSLIRVEADEATYNLHIMLRLEIEVGLLDGSIKVKDLPEMWNSKINEYLGITPTNDSEGVLQDIHWSMGLMGYFPSYALGNLISATLWEKMLLDLPDMDDQLRNGKFSNLLGWMNDKIYVHGSKFFPQELVQKITGEKINGDAFIRYLNKKFGEIYNL